MRLTNHELNRNTEAAVKIRKALATGCAASPDEAPRESTTRTSHCKSEESTTKDSRGGQSPCDINCVFADLRRRFLK